MPLAPSEESKMTATWPKQATRAAKIAQDRFKTAQDARRPKMASRRPKRLPKTARNGSKRASREESSRTGLQKPTESIRIRQGPKDSWGVLGNSRGYASNLGVLPQFEIIIIPGACGGVWRDGGSDFNLKEIPKNIC